MKILHIAAHPPFREGIGTVCFYNARALRELGCQVRVYAPNLGTSHLSADMLDAYHLMPRWLSIGNAYLTPALLAAEKADLIHLHFPFIFGSELTLLRAWASRAPLVLTYHNDLIGGGIRRPSFWLYNRLNAPLILNAARKIVVTSFNYASTSIYADTIFRARQNDLLEVFNGVDVEAFHPNVDGDFVRARHGLQTNDFLLLFVSSLDRSHARKGLDLLLQALADIPGSASKLLIVGDGDMRSEYEASAARLGLRERAIFAGRVPQGEMAAHYAASDAVCIPSRPPEAFGLALAQGMAAGKAVIGSDIAGVRLLIRDGEQGFLIPPGDRAALVERILTLAGNPALRAQMGAAGRERILQNFTWKRAAEKLLAIYREILSH